MTCELLRKAEADYDDKIAALETSFQVLKKIKGLLPSIPDIIAAQYWFIFKETEPGKWYMETYCLQEEEADELIKQLKVVGVHGL